MLQLVGEVFFAADPAARARLSRGQGTGDDLLAVLCEVERVGPPGFAWSLLCGALEAQRLEAIHG